MDSGAAFGGMQGEADRGVDVVGNLCPAVLLNGGVGLAGRHYRQAPGGQQGTEAHAEGEIDGFSNCPLSSLAPASSPPWAASSNTTNLTAGAGGRGAGVGAVCCAAAIQPVANVAAITGMASLVQRIDGKAAEQLGKEVG